MENNKSVSEQLALLDTEINFQHERFSEAQSILDDARKKKIQLLLVLIFEKNRGAKCYPTLSYGEVTIVFNRETTSSCFYHHENMTAHLFYDRATLSSDSELLRVTFRGDGVKSFDAAKKFIADYDLKVSFDAALDEIEALNKKAEPLRNLMKVFSAPRDK